MNKHKNLSYRHLRDALFEVIRIHDDLSELTPFRSDVDIVLSAETYPDFIIEINFPAISQLAHTLQIMTAVDVGRDLGSLAELMAEVATMVNRPGRIISDKMRGSRQITMHESKICMEFSIVCAVSFAQYHGYDIGGLLQDDIYRALLFSDWERLVLIFRRCLSVVDREGPEALLQRIERQFEGNPDRLISAQSYWNLRSVAEQEGWSMGDVLMLIEAHLNPMLDSHLVHRSSTVSGNDWRRLYDWIHQGDGRMLWRV